MWAPELVVRVHDSERTSDTFGAESMRANIFTAASSPFSERTREILLVFPENEATAAAAFAVQHLIGKSLNSHLVVFRGLQKAKIVEIPVKIILVATFCREADEVCLGTLFLFHTAPLDGAEQSPSPAEARHVVA